MLFLSLVNQHFVHLQLRIICYKRFRKGKAQGKIVLQLERSQKTLFIQFSHHGQNIKFLEYRDSNRKWQRKSLWRWQCKARGWRWQCLPFSLFKEDFSLNSYCYFPSLEGILDVILLGISFSRTAWRKIP